MKVGHFRTFLAICSKNKEVSLKSSKFVIFGPFRLKALKIKKYAQNHEKWRTFQL